MKKQFEVSVTNLRIYPLHFRLLKKTLEPFFNDLDESEQKEIRLDNSKVVGYRFEREDFDSLGQWVQKYPSDTSFDNGEYQQSTHVVDNMRITVLSFVNARTPFKTVQIEERYHT